jgi:hypothetical protein
VAGSAKAVTSVTMPRMPHHEATIAFVHEGEFPTPSAALDAPRRTGRRCHSGLRTPAHVGRGSGDLVAGSAQAPWYDACRWGKEP